MKSQDELATTVTQGYHALREVTCLEDVYDIMDFLQEEVKAHYTDIVCKIDCSGCCKGALPPIITALEWEMILYYIQELPDLIQDEIVRRARVFSQNYRDALLLQYEIVNNSELGREEITGYYQTIKSSLRESACPFLVVDRCGIYPVRPARCHANGNFLAKVGEEIKIHACWPEIARWENQMKETGDRKITMPLWDTFDTVIGILNPPESVTMPIPLWMITHIDPLTGKFFEEVDPNPVIAI